MFRNKYHHKNFSIIIIIILIVLLVYSCESQNDESSGDEKTRTATVKVQTIKPEVMELTTKATGVLRSRFQIPISPEITGRVIDKILDIGDPVAENEVFLIIDPEPYELVLAQAEAGFAAAQAAYEQALRDYERHQKLYADDDVSAYQLETARLAERTAQANLQSAQASFKLAQRNLRLTRLASPIDGYIAELNVQIGQQVSPGMPLGTIIDLKQIEVEIGLSQKEIVNMEQGISVRLKTDVFPKEIFIGKVRSVGMAGLGIGKTFPVIISVDNSSCKLKPGIMMNIEVVYAVYQDILAVPRESVIIDDSGYPAIWVVDNDVAELRQVILGPTEGSKIMIKSGVLVGDQVVIEGQNTLHDSILVKIF